MFEGNPQTPQMWCLHHGMTAFHLWERATQSFPPQKHIRQHLIAR